MNKNNKKQVNNVYPKNMNKGYNQNEEASYDQQDQMMSEKYKENSNAHE